MALAPTSLPALAAGLSMLVLGAVLLRYGVGRAPNWLLALALLMHAGSSLVGVAVNSLDDPGTVAWLEDVRPYFQMAIAPAFIAFAMYYPRPRAWGKADAVKPIALAALILVGPCAYFASHDLFDGANAPLRVSFNALLVAYGALAFVLLREWARAPVDAPLRAALLATSLAFALIHIYDAVMIVGVDILARLVGQPPPMLRALVGIAGLAAYGPFLILLARERRSVHRELRAFVPLVVAGIVLGVGVIAAALASLSLALPGLLDAASRADVVLDGLADLTFPVILAFAVLRHQLLDIDVKLRWTISKSTIAAAFVAAFFLVSEGAQVVLGSRNAYIGLLGAAALVFAMAPLQRAAERFAERAVPRGTAQTALDPGLEAEAAYRTAVRLALRDRVLTREEERHLLRLAHHAGISAPRALAIHDEVEGESRTNQP